MASNTKELIGEFFLRLKIELTDHALQAIASGKAIADVAIVDATPLAFPFGPRFHRTKQQQILFVVKRSYQ